MDGPVIAVFLSSSQRGELSVHVQGPFCLLWGGTMVPEAGCVYGQSVVSAAAPSATAAGGRSCTRTDERNFKTLGTQSPHTPQLSYLVLQILSHRPRRRRRRRSTCLCRVLAGYSACTWCYSKWVTSSGLGDLPEERGPSWGKGLGCHGPCCTRGLAQGQSE